MTRSPVRLQARPPLEILTPSYGGVLVKLKGGGNLPYPPNRYAPPYVGAGRMGSTYKQPPPFLKSGIRIIKFLTSP
jgi:hypothetical protein